MAVREEGGQGSDPAESIKERAGCAQEWSFPPDRRDLWFKDSWNPRSVHSERVVDRRGWRARKQFEATDLPSCIGSRRVDRFSLELSGPVHPYIACQVAMQIGHRLLLPGIRNRTSETSRAHTALDLAHIVKVLHQHR